MSPSTDEFKSLKLWYITDDDKRNMDDWFNFGKFGGWGRPFMKTYKIVSDLQGGYLECDIGKYLVYKSIELVYCPSYDKIEYRTVVKKY